MGGRVTALMFIIVAILVGGVGIWLFIEDSKTVQATVDKLDSLDRKISAQETLLNQKLAGYISQITAAIEKDKPAPPQAQPQIVYPVDVRIVGPVRFVPSKRKPAIPPLPKSLLPKEKKLKPSER